jgi:hypothetical protein
MTPVSLAPRDEHAYGAIESTEIPIRIRALSLHRELGDESEHGHSRTRR